MSERTSLGILLRRYRLAVGLSQEALAARAGLSARAISDLERGLHTTPHASTLELLAAALSLSSHQRAMLLAAARPELDGAPPLASAALAPTLPLPPTALIGREQEQARAKAVLLSDGCRLLTLSGPSGVGKTRLALQLALDLAATFADGVTFVDLAAIRDAALVPATIAQTLGVREEAGLPLVDQVCARLRDQHFLLVLDNFEHLAEAASFVADLLARSPRLSVLVTSRAPLRLRWEQVLPLLPLPLEDAIALFCERAQAVRPGETYTAPEVAAICERVDRLPLAIELAAVQVRVLSLPQILQQMTQRLALLRGGPRDLPARHRTMEDAIGWSYDLLTEPEQRCYWALGIFAGGWTLEAAQAVCSPEGSAGPHEAILTLAKLVDASLVQTEIPPGGTVRFGMLQLVREYAARRLRAAGEEDACRRRHATYYAHLIESAALTGPGVREADRSLTRELANARAALEWAEQHGEAALGLRLAGFCRLWDLSGQMGEAVAWQERMLALDARAREQDQPVAPVTLRVERLYGFARAMLSHGQIERAEVLSQEALDLASSTGDERGISNAWATCGLIAQASGKLEQAAAAFAQCYMHAGLARHSELETRALVHLGELARAQGDAARATALFEEALARAHASEAIWDVAIITTLLGHLVRQRQDYTEARARYHESLLLLRGFDSPTYLAWCLEGVAATLSAAGDWGRAVRLGATAAALREQARTPLPPAERDALEQMMSAAHSALGESAFHAEWAAGSARPPEGAIGEALAATEHGRTSRTSS